MLLPWSGYEIWSHLSESGAVIPASQFLSFRMVMLLSGSGIAAFLLNYNNFLIFKYMDSPVAVAVFTNLRKVMTILASILLFEQGAVESLNVVGMVITFVGVGIYSMQEMGEKRRKLASKSARRENIV